MLKSSAGRACVAALFVCCLIGILSGCFLLPNRPPVAAFVVNYNTTEDPLVVELDASSSSDPDNDAIVTYMWAFITDDPAGPAIIEPVAQSAVRSIPRLLLRYPAEDISQIQLVVTDERGAMSDPAIQQITVPYYQVYPTLQTNYQSED